MDSSKDKQIWCVSTTTGDREFVSVTFWVGKAGDLVVNAVDDDPNTLDMPPMVAIFAPGTWLKVWKVWKI